MRYLYPILTFLAITLVAESQTINKSAEIRAYATYGYNYTWEHYGNFEFWSRVPVNQHFEFDAAAQLSTANIYSLSVDARPLFALPTGEMYIDTRLLYRAIVRNRIHEATASLSVGYRMDYVDVSIGMLSRLMSDFDRSWHSEDEILTEPIDFLYGLELFVRPQSSNWNISFRISDFDDFQIERMWQPMFMLGGSYRPTDKLTILLQTQYKPTGMFHLNASFYGMYARVGISYKL